MIKRARKAVETARCCWVCGKLGGAGFTTALRAAGYDVKPDEIAYAHGGCMTYAKRRWARMQRFVMDSLSAVPKSFGDGVFRVSRIHDETTFTRAPELSARR